MRDRMVTRTEWVAEPTDAFGDITDPQYVRTEREARTTVSFSDPDVVYWDIARVRRTGSDSEGEIDREYQYVERIYRDGRAVALDTIGGSEPVERVTA